MTITHPTDSLRLSLLVSIRTSLASVSRRTLTGCLKITKRADGQSGFNSLSPQSASRLALLGSLCVLTTDIHIPIMRVSIVYVWIGDEDA